MCIRVWSPVDVRDLGLQGVIKAPGLPSSAGWSLAALVESHGANFGTKKILKACGTENGRVCLFVRRRSCGVTRKQHTQMCCTCRDKK